jgi:hypothetical protein
MCASPKGNWPDRTLAAAKANTISGPDAPTSTPGAKVRTDVAVALGSFVPAACLSGVYSHRVATAFWIALGIVAPIELLGIGPLLEANHPIRIMMPAILGALAYSELSRQHATWSRMPKAYVMGLLTFALAGVDVVALFFHALSDEWIVPGFTVLFCSLICVVALIPEGRVSWLRS